MENQIEVGFSVVEVEYLTDLIEEKKDLENEVLDLKADLARLKLSHKKIVNSYLGKLLIDDKEASKASEYFYISDIVKALELGITLEEIQNYVDEVRKNDGSAED